MYEGLGEIYAIWEPYLLGKRIWFALSAANKLLFMKEGAFIYLFILLQGDESHIWDLVLYSYLALAALTVFITEVFLSSKVTFKGVAQLRNSEAKFQCLRCNLYKLFSVTVSLCSILNSASLWPGLAAFVLLLYATTNHTSFGFTCW